MFIVLNGPLVLGGGCQAECRHTQAMSDIWAGGTRKKDAGLVMEGVWVSLAGGGEHPRRFIDDQQIVVLIKDIQLRLPVRVRQ